MSTRISTIIAYHAQFDEQLKQINQTMKIALYFAQKRSNSFLVKKLESLLNELRLILLSQLTGVFSQYELMIEISNDFQNSEHSCLVI